VPDDIHINSHKGKYSVIFENNSLDILRNESKENSIYIIDKNISKLYKSELRSIIESKKCLIIEASESNKSLDKFPSYTKSLIDLGIKRNQTLVSIGGGIIQDISCFLASTLMRGLQWIFYPTTLLAQSDSCIGSKSSINSGDLKNILGTFNPPKRVILDTNFLETLKKEDIYSGIGEMIKVHAIDSLDSFKRISNDYEKILLESSSMAFYIHESLLMKKKLIEIDEFDEGPRNVMNYGHSFGHAIESATNYSIPHGIAVTIGMDMANFVAAELNISTSYHFDRMHEVLDKNCSNFRNIEINVELLMNALYKDKKNTKNQLRLIFPDNEGQIMIDLYDKTPELQKGIANYLNLYQV